MQSKHQSEKMPLYPHSILKKPSEFPPVPFDIEDNISEEIMIEDDNDSLDVILPNRDLNDFSDFDRPTAKPGKFCFKRSHLNFKKKLGIFKCILNGNRLVEKIMNSNK